MKKFFTLLGVLLLWQTMAMAQDYVKVLRGDSCLADIPLAQLDSITLRPKKFYDWQYVGTGTYEFTHVFNTTRTCNVYCKQFPDDIVKVRVENWLIDGYHLIITLNSETGRCVVEPQPCGYEHNTYGMIYVTDGGTYTGKHDTYVSSYDEESETFNLFMVYYVDAGTFGYGNEMMTMNFDDEENEARQASRVKVKLPVNMKLQDKQIQPQHTQVKQLRPNDMSEKMPVRKVQQQNPVVFVKTGGLELK